MGIVVLLSAEMRILGVHDAFGWWYGVVLVFGVFMAFMVLYL
jgi:hypothetical protein